MEGFAVACFLIRLWDFAVPSLGLETAASANLSAAGAAKLARPGQLPDLLAPAILHELQQFGDSMEDRSRNRPVL